MTLPLHFFHDASATHHFHSVFVDDDILVVDDVDVLNDDVVVDVDVVDDVNDDVVDVDVVVDGSASRKCHGNGVTWKRHRKASWK